MSSGHEYKPRTGHARHRPIGVAKPLGASALCAILLAISTLVTDHAPFTQSLGPLPAGKAPGLAMAQQGNPFTAATVFLPHLMANGLEDAKTAIQLDLEWQFGSPIQAVAVDGRYGYVGRSRQLVVLDLSDPLHPIAIGESDALTGTIIDIAYADDHVVLTTSRGLHVFDVATPSNPREIASVEEPDALNVALLSGHAYVTSGYNRLWIYDISDPAAPWRVQALRIESTDVTVSGHHVFVAGGYSNKGLQVFDGTDPKNLREIGSVSVPNALAVEVSGSHAYLINEGEEGLVVVDIANPAEPRTVGSYGEWVYIDGVPSFAVSGDYALLPGKNLLAIDVSNPSEPRPADARFFNTPGQVWDIAILGNQAYVADGGGGLRILDISGPAPFTEVGVFDSAGIASEVTAAEDTIFIAAGEAGLRILDTSNPNEPRQLTVVDTPGQAVDIALAHGHVYIADDSGGLRIVDVTPPAEATEVGFMLSPEPVRQIVVEGDLAFINPESGLVIFDLTDPARPREIGSFPTAEGIIAVQDGYLFLADRKNLFVIDVHDPTRPAIVGRASTTEYQYGAIPEDIAIVDKYVFLAQDFSGVRVFDISTPQSPRQAARFRTHTARAMTSRSPLVFTGIGRSLRVFDASIPNVPGLIAEIALDNSIWGDTALSAHGDHLFRLGNAFGVAAYRISP